MLNHWPTIIRVALRLYTPPENTGTRQFLYLLHYTVNSQLETTSLFVVCHAVLSLPSFPRRVGVLVLTPRVGCFVPASERTWWSHRR